MQVTGLDLDLCSSGLNRKKEEIAMRRKAVKNNNKYGWAAFALCGTLTVGGLIGLNAYFSDTKELTNVFEIGSVETTLEEPGFPTENTDLTPNKTIVKDPTITNTGENSGYVFLSVDIPKYEVMAADVATGERLDRAPRELFYINSAAAAADGAAEKQKHTVNDGWVEMMEESYDFVQEDVTYTRHIFVYGVKTASGSKTAYHCTALAPGQKTKVFDAVTFANVIEDQGLEGASLQIPVRSYAIQTSDLTDEDSADATTILGLIDLQTAETAIRK